jgi:hypothetical protein
MLSRARSPGDSIGRIAKDPLDQHPTILDYDTGLQKFK